MRQKTHNYTILHCITFTRGGTSDIVCDLSEANAGTFGNAFHLTGAGRMGAYLVFANAKHRCNGGFIVNHLQNAFVCVL